MQRFRFTPAMRLTHKREFAAVFDARCRKSVGPFAVLALPSLLDVPHHRLGLSIGRRVGNAVRRHKVKRMLREAFRLDQHTWPGRYDLVVVAYPHEPLTLEAYRKHFRTAVDALHRRLASPE